MLDPTPPCVPPAAPPPCPLCVYGPGQQQRAQHGEPPWMRLTLLSLPLCVFLRRPINHRSAARRAAASCSAAELTDKDGRSASSPQHKQEEGEGEVTPVKEKKEERRIHAGSASAELHLRLVLSSAPTHLLDGGGGRSSSHIRAAAGAAGARGRMTHQKVEREEQGGRPRLLSLALAVVRGEDSCCPPSTPTSH
ncbi:hypothetical protein FQA47_024275 [Oryzias melastigma]|uniref:Uncharacterized protein n=1 Tax=Oryzias melastigma TaxID=30732 RepID=A0A834BVH2_ORYME|nr:hypothetical protein FQA47_024275 [Oryzias melastigma]